MVLGPTARMLLPYLNFTIATSALVFQTTVLYPWHHELDTAFQTLKADQLKVLKEFHEIKLERIKELERRLSVLGTPTEASGVEDSQVRSFRCSQGKAQWGS
ncbi:hypothetical protein J3R30DRAFT_3428159 [Lentinula aciculospora]|uniref:Uncharacterized protein n=1 Tax=Lentinula aciculospora TaxID=153920 RepID=A0A9W9AWM2_9AGAR|nr:hypothetical protein J3R30DRAFT_3428159 [Lentinula aciculospora]